MGGRFKRLLLFLPIFFFVCAPSHATGWEHIGNVQKVERLKDGVEITAENAKVRVSFFRDGIVRVRVAHHGVFPKDYSWAVIEAAEPPAFSLKEEKAEIRISSGNIIVQITKSPLLINFLDSAGNTILADEPSLPMAWNGSRVEVCKKMPLLENYYGLGDRAGTLNRRNRAFALWNTDSYGWEESTEPVYKTIPFFIGMNAGKAYGIFFDNTYRDNFNFGLESQDFYSFGADGGAIDYYFFAGPEPKKIVQAFAELTGKTKLPPYWTLGFQQSRYSYYPESRVYEIASTFREKKIPADAIYLDIDYQQGYAPFTVNREYFPHFEKMIADLSQQGFHTVLITDLHIKHDPDHGYAPYDTGMKQDVFVKKPDGSLYVAPVWPGLSVFPDFTLSRVRDWWGSLYKDFVGMGVAGFWNDMDEPAVFETPTKTMPLDNLHRLDDGSTLDHRAIHNVYGQQNVKATYEGLLKLRPNERPFVLTRAAYAGTQRYAATWTGDNISTWNHLRISTPIMLNMGLSGYPFVGSDIGGFVGSPPSDLLTRWIELGVFNPIYRDHTGKFTADQEPWANGDEEQVEIRKRYIELRYRMLPYIYTAVEETARTGLPIMRPVFLEYPASPEFYEDERDFLFGRDLYVSPVATELMDPMVVKLPPGTWYDYWTSTAYTNKDKIELRPKIDQVPLYVRGGAILPMQPVVQNTSEIPAGPLELRVYPGADCQGSLYQDDGHSFGYQSGEFLRVQYSCSSTPETLSVSSHIVKNGYKTWWDSTKVTVYGLASSPKEIRVGEKVVSGWQYDAASHSAAITVPDAASDWTIRVVAP
jgi:alpha-glucosidase